LVFAFLPGAFDDFLIVSSHGIPTHRQFVYLFKKLIWHLVEQHTICDNLNLFGYSAPAHLLHKIYNFRVQQRLPTDETEAADTINLRETPEVAPE
jgi:hypothetical protein